MKQRQVNRDRCAKCNKQDKLTYTYPYSDNPWEGAMMCPKCRKEALDGMRTRLGDGDND